MSNVVGGSISMRPAGITLIALVITIIVLLILAGVALYMTLGDSGIFGKANNAKEQTNINSATELMNLKILEIKTKGYTENETVDLQYIANNLIADTEIEYVSNTSNPTEPYPDTIDTTGKTAIYTKLKAYPYEFTINDGMEISNIDGQAISTSTSGGSSSGSTGGSASGGIGTVSDYTTISYSTDEQSTGAKWIDGNEIYTRVLDLGYNFTITTSTSDFSSEVIPSDIYMPIKSVFYVIQNTGSLRLAYDPCSVFYDIDKWRYRAIDNWGASNDMHVYLYLEYTKKSN